ncbi:MAG: hypothetical protein IH845_00065 [Nanoarchaeota archaeon]|nr:hypothetical protein [Nanoarchaeota archaeon]
MIIRKIFDGNINEEIHNEFLKFGKGDYKDKFLMEGKRQPKKWSVKTGPEFVNFLVRRSLDKVGRSVQVKGIIVSTIDLRGEIDFDIVKVGNFQGIRKLQIDTEVEVAKIFELMDKYPRAFFALSFTGDGFVLKVKAKAPKSGKPGKSSEEGPKVDFCTLKTDDSTLIDELFWENIGFTEIKIAHDINVTDIVYPSNMDDLKPSEIREQSKRKGILTRRIICDGKKTSSKVEFVI